MRIPIPLSQPEISGNEWKYVKDCLDSGWVSSVGSYVDSFEKIIAGYIGAEQAVATVNGTAALHVSLIVCGVRPGDEVIVPTLTFIAPVNAVRYCGANPVFMDCEPHTLCIDVCKVKTFLEQECEIRDDGYTYNRKSQRRVKAVIPVHIFGHAADMDGLVEICRKGTIDIVEDATESIGSEYKGKRTGSFGRMGCFSFNGNKIITTGGGGMLVTNDRGIADAARHLTTQAKCDPLEYDHDEIGYNYRLTNLQAAVGVAQMERLEEFIRIKRENAAVYRALLTGVEGATFLWERPSEKSNFWFYAIRVAGEHKKNLMSFLLSKGVQVRPVWKLIHTLPMYRGFPAYRIENAIDAYETCINLPCSIGLKRGEIELVVKHIRNYFRNTA